MLNRVTRAIFRRDLRRWFGNPTGYVFIVLFVGLAAAAMFWPNEFFQRNLANLDTLNDWYPLLLLFFVPAVTMSVWAGERGQGTDELLLTLPASDWQIVMGKFLAAGGIFSVALLFTLPIVVFLAFLGSPDWGLMLANYFGFWLLGLTLIAAGMIGSQMSDNLTVAFILGAILCGFVVKFEAFLDALLPGVARSWRGFGPVSLFQETSRGILSLSALLLFLGLIGVFLYINLLLLSRRHWRSGNQEGVHYSLRSLALLVGAIALTAIGANLGSRGDFTSEQVHSLSGETSELIAAIPDDRRVYIQAYVSPEVPADYVQTRRTLLDLLRQYDSIGGGKIEARVIPTERFSDAAREAEKNFGIRHETRVVEEQGRTRTADLFMGVAFTCGIDEVVVPFLDKGLPVEYELTRSIRVVSSAKRRKVGILENDLKVFADFDFQSGRQSPEWDIVQELKLQYDVEKVNADEAYPDGIDVLIAMMPSSLTQPQMDHLANYVKAGKPTLLIDDPTPMDPLAQGLAPDEPKGGPRNPFQQNQPPAEEKGDIFGLLTAVGIRWPVRDVVWDTSNPHPQFNVPDKELVFLHGKGAFNEDSAITKGLQEVVAIFGGHVEPAGKSGFTFVPLLRSSQVSGVIQTGQIFTRNFLGMKQFNPNRGYRRDAGDKVMACRVSGGDDKAKANVIFVADLDIVSSEFFRIRRQGFENINFDNVTFLLNCVDDLAGDASFIDLRKRRPKHRTLASLEAKAKEFNDQWLVQKEDAESRADTELGEAQNRLNEAIRRIEENKDLDDQSKQIQIETVRNVEQRRLDVQKDTIEDQRNQAVDLALASRLRAEDHIRDLCRIGSVSLIPIPAILMGLLGLLRRSGRERETADKRRLAGGAS